MDYEKKYKEAIDRAKKLYEQGTIIESLGYVFPELKEPEDELKWLKQFIQEEAYSLSLDIRDNEDRIKLKNLQRALTWLGKQGQQKPAEWSEEDMSKIQRICKYLNEAKKYYADITEVRECIDWLKSLKEKYTWKPSEEQMNTFWDAISNLSLAHYKWINDLKSLYQDLKKLREG